MTCYECKRGKRTWVISKLPAAAELIDICDDLELYEFDIHEDVFPYTLPPIFSHCIPTGRVIYIKNSLNNIVDISSLYMQTKAPKPLRINLNPTATFTALSWDSSDTVDDCFSATGSDTESSNKSI